MTNKCLLLDIVTIITVSKVSIFVIRSIAMEYYYGVLLSCALVSLAITHDTCLQNFSKFRCKCLRYFYVLHAILIFVAGFFNRLIIEFSSVEVKWWSDELHNILEDIFLLSLLVIVDNASVFIFVECEQIISGQKSMYVYTR